MRSRSARFHVLVTAVLALLGLGVSAAPRERHIDTSRDSLQRAIDELVSALRLTATVRARIVTANPLLVSVESADDGRHFDISFQESFLAGLTEDELRTVVAHELGHVWIFTHHPYLQTERLANDVAMRVVSRDSLARVYDKVWAARGVKGDLAQFLPAPQ